MHLNIFVQNTFLSERDRVFFFEAQLDHCDLFTVTAFRHAFRKQGSFGSRPMDRNKTRLSDFNEQNI